MYEITVTVGRCVEECCTPKTDCEICTDLRHACDVSEAKWHLKAHTCNAFDCQESGHVMLLDVCSRHLGNAMMRIQQRWYRGGARIPARCDDCGCVLAFPLDAVCEDCEEAQR